MKNSPAHSLQIIFIGMLTVALLSNTPANAWGRGGWGYGGYGGWGYGGYGYGAAIAGAAVAGLALGAIAASATPYPYGYGYNYYSYGPPRLCIVNQPVYDGWGNFAGYQRVRTPC